MERGSNSSLAASHVNGRDEDNTSGGGEAKNAKKAVCAGGGRDSLATATPVGNSGSNGSQPGCATRYQLGILWPGVLLFVYCKDETCFFW